MASKTPEPQGEDGSGKIESDPFINWNTFTQALSTAGNRMNEATKDLSPEERADGFRALMRAVHNQLARLVVDRA